MFPLGNRKHIEHLVHDDTTMSSLPNPNLRTVAALHMLCTVRHTMENAIGLIMVDQGMFHVKPMEKACLMEWAMVQLSMVYRCTFHGIYVTRCLAHGLHGTRRFLFHGS